MKYLLRSLTFGSILLASNFAHSATFTPAATTLWGVPVVTSPHVGLRSAFDGSDLVVNFPSIDEDVRLLEQRVKIEKQMPGAKFPDHPILDISGKIQGLMFINEPYQGDTDGDIDLSGAELDFVAHINNTVTGFIAVTYDNSPPELFRQRTTNSRFFLDKGFVTMGRLQDCPIYMTIGQLYVPFGRYSSAMLSSPAPLLIARYKGRAVVLGYSELGDNRIFGSVYAFDGDIRTPSRLEGGAKLGAKVSRGPWSVEAAASFISNMANADHSLLTGGTTFTGFGANATTARLQKRVPGAGAYAIVGYAGTSLITEFVSATERYNPIDLSFNGRGARPYGLQVELNHNFELEQRPALVAVAYNKTGEAFALNVPEHSLLAFASLAVWRDVIFAVEYRHSINYDNGTTGSGNNTAVSTANLGRSTNTGSFKVSAYF